MEEEVEYAFGPVLHPLHVDLEDVVLELPGLVDELLEELDDGVDDVLVAVVDQREEDLQMLAEEAVVVLLAGVLDDLDDLQHQRLRAAPADLAVDLLGAVNGLVGVALVVDVEQDAADLVGLAVVGDVAVEVLDDLVV